jgi:small basic protein
MNIIIGSLVGVLIAIYLPYTVPQSLAVYMGVIILASFDTILGGIEARQRGNFRADLFLTGFFGNSLLAAGITAMGVKLGIALYLAPVIFFGSRLFNNFAKIRRNLLNVYPQSYTISGSGLYNGEDTRL